MNKMEYIKMLLYFLQDKGYIEIKNQLYAKNLEDYVDEFDNLKGDV